jgi:hypothetical protein
LIVTESPKICEVEVVVGLWSKGLVVRFGLGGEDAVEEEEERDLLEREGRKWRLSIGRNTPPEALLTRTRATCLSATESIVDGGTSGRSTR